MEKTSVTIVAACLLLVAFSGCTDGGPGPGAGVHDCQTGGFEDQPGEWAGVSCQEAAGSATFTDELDCQAPEESAVGGSLQNAEEGTLTITVEDAAGETVFEGTYDAGEHPVGDFIGEGEPGEWTVTVDLSGDFQSDAFGIGAGCMNEDEGGGSGEDSGSGMARCDENSNVEMQGQSMGQVYCENHQGEETLEATFQCGNPQQGGASWGAEMTGGEVTITAQDADGGTVLEETFSGDDDGFEAFGDAPAGEWTLVAELTSDFEGSFNAQAQCSTG